ncbi:hypothetical protein EA187_03180 [Lujinxingia sediminis]|uniref:Uncharacterized protein n=1 Tax=Lujinxingia sediminis TaxID=2480984 RepID=A0ABY0CX33_9DELT|nr:hypothetical protein [Lujinxingia sediminis]RVU48452.1 hypothetical protein EA187_03180 [Lujinxingia sediminis]
MPLVEELRPPSTDMRFVQRCPTTEFTPARTGPWISAASERLANTQPPTHQVPDQIITTGQPITLNARLTYGKSPLQGEWARIFWGGCERGWEQVGHVRTDDDGRLSWPLATRPARGRYAYAVQVVGDRTFATGHIWVVAPEVRAVAIAASAILRADTGQPDAQNLSSSAHKDSSASTPDSPGASPSSEVATAADIADDSTSPEAPPQPASMLTPGARDLAAYYARRGHLIIYLNDDPRGTPLTSRTLAELGLPAGPVLTMAEQGDAPLELTPPGNRWEDASALATGGGPPLPIILTHYFVATADDAQLPPSLPLTPGEVVARNNAEGWDMHLKTLPAEEGAEPQPSHQIIRPAHAVPNHPRAR